MIDKNGNPSPSSEHDSDAPGTIVDAALATLRDQPIPPGPSAELMAATLAALRAGGEATNRRYRLGAFLNPSARIAAGVLLAVGAIAVAWIVLRPSTATWAQVVKKVAAAHFLSADIQVLAEGRPPFQTRMIMSEQGQISMDMPNDARMVVDQSAHRMILLSHETKSAIDMDMAAEPAADQPINILDQFRMLADKDSKNLGDDEVDGRKTRKFQADNMGMNFTVWADEQTGYPVRIEIVTAMTGAPIREILHNFVLNPTLPGDAFSMEIPRDYTVRHIQVDAPDVKNGESTIVAVLDGYARRSGGKFPAKINDVGELLNIIKARAVAGITGATSQNIMPNDQDMKWIVQFGSVQPFLAALGKDHWGYTGAGKTTADQAALIFWYKSPKACRGIYGDLSVKDLAAPPK